MSRHSKFNWAWVREHKKEVVIAGAISVVSAIGGIILYKNFGSTSALKDWNPPKLDEEIDKLLDGNIFRRHDGAIEVFIYEDIPLAVMGKLGEYLADCIPDLPDDPKSVYVELAIPY